MWQQCLDRLEAELTIQQFNTWIRPLQAVEDGQQPTYVSNQRSHSGNFT